MANGLINKSLIMKAWTFLREKEMSIPNETLDFMRDAALDKCAEIELGELGMKNNPTINFCYFTGNFPHDFINQVWKDEKLLAEHLNAKFDALVKRENVGYASYNVFMKWFFELDGDNKLKLIVWVGHNYNYKS